jgi:hypothetical protein
VIAFVVGIGPVRQSADAAAGKAFEEWRDRYGPVAGQPIHRWSSSGGRVRCFWLVHDPEFLGGVSYTATSADGFALFCGRPILWGDSEADGRAGIDAASYLADPAHWSARVDGRYAVVRAIGERLQLQTDPVGLQPVYESKRDGVTWFSNVAPLIERPADAVDHRALVTFLSTGEATIGMPLSAAVARVRPGALLTVDAEGLQRMDDANVVTPKDFTHQADYAEATRLLVSACAAMADWPGRPHGIELTGGHDSRLIGVAMRRAGIGAHATTIAFDELPGFPGTEDAVLGKRLAKLLGYTHETIIVDRHSPVYTAMQSVVETLRLTSPGTIALNDALDLCLDLPRSAMPIVFDGLGGEFARSAYDHRLGENGTGLAYRSATTIEAVAEGVMRRLLPERPRALVSEDGVDVVRAWLIDFVRQTSEAGFTLEEIPEICFIHHTGTWHGSKTTPYQYRMDGVSPLMTRRLWPHMFGQPLIARQTGTFHRELMDRLGPEVMRMPYYSGSAPYEGHRRRVRARGWGLERRVRAARSKLLAHMGFRADPIVHVQRAVRAAMADQPGHAAWEVLDRDRVRELMAKEPRELAPHRDRTSRYQIWRLATLFCS